MRSYSEIKNIKLVNSQVTVGNYLTRLLVDLWKKGEAFNSKRPFGTSSWQYDIYAAFVNARIIDGALDEDGCVINADTDKADKIVIAAIKEALLG